MAFEAIAIKQVVQVKLTGKGTTMEGTLPSVSAGSALVVIGSGICESTWDALLLTSVSGGGSWGTPRNAASVFSYVPNVFACEAPNVSASASPVTVTLTVNGASNNKATWLLLEIEKSVASNVVDKFMTAIDATGVSPATLASTGTLSQTDNLVLAALGGWTNATVASMESAGFTTLIAQANSSYLGLYVGWKKVTSVAEITQTIPHSAEGANAAALLVLKAEDAAGSLKIRFQVRPDLFTAGTDDLSVEVWRNGPTSGVLAKVWTGQSVASNGILDLTTDLPAGLSVTDTIIGYITDGTKCTGHIVGEVVQV